MAENLKEIKKAMIEYRDFFGSELIGVSEVNSAKSKEELAQIIEKHHEFISDQANDAQNSLNRFKQKIGL